MVCVADVLSEEAILKWYTEGHLAKGKSVFLEQMKKFVEWLKNAEEGKAVFSHTCTRMSQYSLLQHPSFTMNHHPTVQPPYCHVLLQEATTRPVSSLFVFIKQSVSNREC